MIRILSSTLSVIVVLVAAGCCDKKQDQDFEEAIIGEWLTTDHDSIIYTFNQDLTGQYIIPSGPVDYTWEIKCAELKLCTNGSGSSDPDCGGTQKFDVLDISGSEMRLDEHTGFPARTEREPRFFARL